METATASELHLTDSWGFTKHRRLISHSLSSVIFDWRSRPSSTSERAEMISYSGLFVSFLHLSLRISYQWAVSAVFDQLEVNLASFRTFIV